MGKRVLVTGGIRSGKSSFGERHAEQWGQRGIYLATARALDEEMTRRVDTHKARREKASFSWTTIEVPYDLTEQLQALKEECPAVGQGEEAVLVDCLNLWLANWFLRLESEDRERDQEPDYDDYARTVMEKIGQFALQLSDFPGNIVLVTNEVGDSLVSEYPLGRRFQDCTGWMNQRMAAVCDEVYLVTAGIPVELKQLSAAMKKRARP